MYNILLVDDDDAIRFIYNRYTIWSQCGFNIKAIVNNGKEALEALETSTFDLIITDIKMPIINGLELLELIRKKGCQLPVILASTYSEFEYAQQGLRLGATDYILKPVYETTLEPLLNKVKEHLDKQALLLEKEQVICSKIEEGLSLYAPLEDTRELIELFITLSPHLKDQLELWYYKAIDLFGLGSTKMIFFLEHIINKLYTDLYTQFNWLKMLEPAPPKLSLSELSPSQLKNGFYEIIFSMQQLITKYHLSHQDRVIHLACRYLAENLQKLPSMQDVADALSLNKDYFGKLFKQQTGIYFNDYVQKLKMEYAKTLLLTSNYKIYEMSDLLGYSSTDYFSKLFKNYTGMTPIHYKNNSDFYRKISAF